MWGIAAKRAKKQIGYLINLRNMREYKNLKIAVAGTGYVGLSMATLLAQHHEVTAVDVVSEKVEKIN